MIAVIPCGGNGERFGLAGYVQPKPCLTLPGGLTLLERVIASLPDDCPVYVVGQARHARDLSAPIQSANLGRRGPVRFVADDETQPQGPLLGVLKAEKYLRGRDELLVAYCDCWLEDSETESLLTVAHATSYDALGVEFDSHDERFSRTPNGFFAVGGLFWFREAREFLKRAKRLARPGAGVPEVLLSFTQFDVPRYEFFRAQHYVDVGVPQDYESYVAHAPLPASYAEMAR